MFVNEDYQRFINSSSQLSKPDCPQKNLNLFSIYHFLPNPPKHTHTHTLTMHTRHPKATLIIRQKTASIIRENPIPFDPRPDKFPAPRWAVNERAQIIFLNVGIIPARQLVIRTAGVRKPTELYKPLISPKYVWITVKGCVCYFRADQEKSLCSLTLSLCNTTFYCDASRIDTFFATYSAFGIDESQRGSLFNVLICM